VNSQRRSGNDGPISTAEKVAFLSRPESYDPLPQAVRRIETHMSWVFIADALVYKMKKPVRLPVLDFSTLAARRHYCEESLRLNRRLAGPVYLDVVPLTLEAGGALRLGGEGEPVEWLERMRRLPEARMLDTAIRNGTVSEADVDRFATVLARFYRNAPPAPMTPTGYRARLQDSVQGNAEALAAPEFALPRDRLRAVIDAQRAFIDRHGELFDQRVESGRIVEGHGDLRPEHVCLLDEPVIIDCLEFNREFRIVDPVDELGYLALECAFAGAEWIGPRLFEIYVRVTGDVAPAHLLGFYQSHRATIRAKLAAWHLLDQPPETHPRWRARADAYLALAWRYASGASSESGERIQGERGAWRTKKPKP
jgi:uncharacterized protein